MNYLIFDLEWNQPSGSDKSPDLPHGEIIQIGFITVNDTMEITRRGELTIKPVVYRKMNPYVSTLTGIKQSDIDAGMTFAEAFVQMRELFTPETVLITWGDDDMPILRDNLKYHGIADDVLPVHYNLQRIFASQTDSKLRQTGLKSALETLGITEEMKAHDALNDAYMTYLIACELDMALGIAKYAAFTEATAAKKPAWESTEPAFLVRLPFDKNPSSFAGECRKLHICCPICGADISGADIFRQGKNSFVAASFCGCRERLFVRYELKNGHITVSAHEMTKELEVVYSARVRSKEKREKRREIYKIIAKAKKNEK
ncbi:MAG: exonuclease domain-containing protein [Ruminiclostridium sp.]|nr:exonuclease domain-containing protein [Ruminiclostridium sp.]